ncbi:MAG TPA: ATP-binding protein [Coleofasciculaceae cyanobacterium]
MIPVKKILIVEDELIPAYDLSDNLEYLGYSVTEIVDSGEAAIQQVQENPPDLILMDIKLKGAISGIEAAAQIMECHAIPIIYLTAYSDQTTLAQAALTSPYGYLTKPIKPEDLRATLAIALSRYEKDVNVRTILNEEKRLNELKSRFLATVAHDLRTPLTNILISLDLLQRYDEKLSDAKKSKHFGQMQAAIRTMTEQLEELLTVNQTESGKLPFNPEPLDAIAFCQDIIESFQASAANKCQLHFSSQGDCTPMNLDRSLLQHILNNLLSNAIKYSPPGSTVNFILTCKPHHCILNIHDQGIGIPPEYLNKLFEPFERAANVNNIKGTGIGLYIVKQAVERHQGNISVESQVGKGTTFIVTLPSVD